MKQSTWMVVGVLFASILLGLAGVFFILPRLSEPPVDISGINLPDYLTTEGVLPTRLADIYLDLNTIQTAPAVATSSQGNFFFNQTIAGYNEIAINILKTDYLSDSKMILDWFYTNNYATGQGSRTKAGDWFKVEIRGRSTFFWRSGYWVFGIGSDDDDTTLRASEDFVEHLRRFSI